MHTSSVVVAALAVAASVVSAAEGEARPKIYFPRHLKRQYSNMTITTQSPASETTTPFDTSSESTKRDSASLSDMFESLKLTYTVEPTFTDKPVFITSTSDPPSSSDTTDSTGASSGNSESVADVTTVIVQSTIVVSPSTDPTPTDSPADAPTDVPSAVGSTGGIPSSIVLPTTSDSVSASASASSDTASPSTDSTSSGLFSSGETSSESTSTSAILLAPSGIVTSATEEPSPTVIDPLAPIGSVISSIVSEVTSAILPSANATETASTVSATSTPVSEETTPTSAEPTDSPLPTTTESVQASATLEQTVEPTTAPSDPTPTQDGVGISLSLLPGTGSSTVVDTTLPVTDPPAGEPTSVVSPPVTNVTDSSLTTPTVGPTDVTAEPTDTALVPTDPPVSVNTTATSPPQSESTVDVTQPPVSEPTLLPPVSTISANVTGGVNTTISDEPTTQLPPPTTTVPAPTSVASITSIPSASGVTSIAATATLSGTETTNWLPTTMVVDQPPKGTTTQRVPTATASTLPSTLPQAITPNSDNTTIPVDTTIIGITFREGLNYEFVASNGVASAQIFQFLPDALRGIQDFPADKIQMVNLGPNVGTQATLGYIATIAKVTFPSNSIDALKLQLVTPNSRLYNHGQEIVKNLTHQINPAIDIITFSLEGGGAAGGSGSSPGSSSGGGGAADPLGGNASGEAATKPGQQGTTAGIALGVIGVAGAYGAAMFIVARRYKRKKQAHRRTSSITNTSEMRSAAGSPHLMGGALLSRDFSSYGGVAGGRNSHGTQGSGRSGANNSARTAYISGPMSAENSLGWN